MGNRCVHYEIDLQIDRCEREGAFAVTGHVQLVGDGVTDVFPVRSFACEDHLGWVFRRSCLTNSIGMVEAFNTTGYFDGEPG